MVRFPLNCKRTPAGNTEEATAADNAHGIESERVHFLTELPVVVELLFCFVILTDKVINARSNRTMICVHVQKAVFFQYNVLSGVLYMHKKKSRQPLHFPLAAIAKSPTYLLDVALSASSS